MCVFVYLYLSRNVITHFLCIVCVWILWWSQTLCSWEQMTRWIALSNLVLEDVRAQFSNKMWYWDIGFYIIYFKEPRAGLLYVISLLNFLLQKKKIDNLVLGQRFFIPLFDKFLIWWLMWMWTCYPR